MDQYVSSWVTRPVVALLGGFLRQNLLGILLESSITRVQSCAVIVCRTKLITLHAIEVRHGGIFIAVVGLPEWHGLVLVGSILTSSVHSEEGLLAAIFLCHELQVPVVVNPESVAKSPLCMNVHGVLLVSESSHRVYVFVQLLVEVLRDVRELALGDISGVPGVNLLILHLFRSGALWNVL